METSPLEWILIFLVVVVPVLGLTARLALKPIVDAILRLQQAFSQTTDSHQIHERMRQMDREITVLQAEVEKLSEVSSFHESMLASRSGKEPKARCPRRVKRSRERGAGRCPVSIRLATTVNNVVRASARLRRAPEYAALMARGHVSLSGR